MMRRRHEEHPNHERWIISYADFVTLMFALFVAMYAISVKDQTSGKRISESVREALETGGLPSIVKSFHAKEEHHGTEGTHALRQDAKPGADGSLEEPFERLSGQLHEQINSGAIRLQLNARGLIITLREKPFFPSGEDALYGSAYPTLERVAQVLAKLPNAVQLEGHTDSIPIHTARFQNNWELSTARSIALLQCFQTRFGLDTSRFAVAGYAQNIPVASNDTAEGRAQNRRVEIIILAQERAAR